jgi:hypothetical protein
MLGLSVVLLLSCGSIALAADETPHSTTAGSTAPHHDAATGAKHEPRPVLPEPSPLPGSVLILIVGLFLAAASVGPAVRYHAPEEPPEPSSHDDGHGAHGHDAHGH